MHIRPTLPASCVGVCSSIQARGILCTCSHVMRSWITITNYLVRVSEYVKTHGELPGIKPIGGGDITMNRDMNDNHHYVGFGDSHEDYVSVQRVRLTPLKNRDPRRPQSTTRRNWKGEDDKNRDQTSPWGRVRKNEKHLCITCGLYYASRSSLL